MSLPQLNWRKLPVYTTSTTTASVSIVLNAIYDMLTGSVYFDGSSRTPGSGSAWTVAGKFTTGSNTEAIYCSPPYTSSLTQSILLCGRNTTGATSGGTPTMTTNEAVFAANQICIGLSKNAGAFTNWTSSLPMGAASSFTGLGRATGVSGGLTAYSNIKLSVYESEEALAITFGYGSAPTANGAFIAGAIFDSEQTSIVTGSGDYENDGRIYGFSRANDSGIGTTFLSGAPLDDFLTHNSISNRGKSVYFLPQTSTLNTVGITGIASGMNSSFLTNSGKLVKMPTYFLKGVSAAYTYFIGTGRGIYIIKDTQNSLIIRDGSSNIIGYVISASDSTANDCILLAHS